MYTKQHWLKHVKVYLAGVSTLGHGHLQLLVVQMYRHSLRGSKCMFVQFVEQTATNDPKLGQRC